METWKIISWSGVVLVIWVLSLLAMGIDIDAVSLTFGLITIVLVFYVSVHVTERLGLRVAEDDQSDS